MIDFKLNMSCLPILDIENHVRICHLSTRRDKIGSLFIYKLLNNSINCPEFLVETSSKVPSINIRHQNHILFTTSRQINRILLFNNEHILSNFDFFFNI